MNDQPTPLKRRSQKPPRPPVTPGQEMGRLSITRKDGERIFIGADVTVEVYRDGCQTRVVISAPKEIPIRREEQLRKAS